MWTPARDAELLRLWPQRSASKIATKLGTTRNAVIGRYHRLDGRYAEKIAAAQEAARDETEKRRAAARAVEATIISTMIAQLARGVARNEAILQARRAGARFEAIGDAVGVTRQRVKQIVA
ncbi:MAG: GcrA family cell cycle regulator [Bryobacteraceae bacterium]